MPSSPAVIAIGTANPLRRYSQADIYDFIAKQSALYRSEKIRQIFMNSDIEYRHLYFNMEDHALSETADELHDRFRTGAIEVGKEAIIKCLASSEIDIREIDYIIAVSCTGYLCPGLSVIMAKELGMRRNIQRADLIGMGCAGAMPGLQRAYDFVKAYPDKKALVLTVEICSACYYIDDSLETVVGNTICGDGAAAVVLSMSDDSKFPKIHGFETLLDPSYIDTVGFEHRDGKLRIILSKDIRSIAGSLAKQLIQNLLTNYQMPVERIAHWILHSGGRKVIDNIQQEMHLTDHQVRHSKSVLQNFGNMSSPTVLFVLEQTMRHSRIDKGEYGLMLAMGPGLAIEGALVQW